MGENRKTRFNGWEFINNMLRKNILNVITNFVTLFGLSIKHNNKMDAKTSRILQFFATNIPCLYITKALKLLYFVDEVAVRETGVPVTNLTHETWENGPVSRDVFNEIHLSAEKNIEIHNCLKATIEKNNKGDDKYRINSIKDCDLSEFSEYELHVLRDVLKEYGEKRAKDLIDIVHQEGSLWHKSVKEHNIKFDENNKSTYHPINLSSLNEDDVLKKLAYYSATGIR